MAFRRWTVSGAPLANPASNIFTFTFTDNTVLAASFVANPFPTSQGVYNGLFYDTNAVTPYSSGKIRLDSYQNRRFLG